MLNYQTISKAGVDRPTHELPFCRYPSASEMDSLGLQPLPPDLPLVDSPAAEPYRSRRYRAIPAAELRPTHVLELARVVAASFARREPQCRHLRPATQVPPGLAAARHRDALGEEAFAGNTREELLYWFIRLMILTDPTSPRSAVRVNEDSLRLSLAIVGADGCILAGAMNETMPPPGPQPVLRQGDPILDAVLGYLWPVLEMLARQDEEAVGALSRAYPAFEAALRRGQVGHHFMVARGDRLHKHDAFELVAASAERFGELGFAYMLVEATNQWTGAACEVLGGVRVHYHPFRAQRAVAARAEPAPDMVSSPDGYLSAKDGGSMFYVLRLR